MLSCVKALKKSARDTTQMYEIFTVENIFDEDFCTTRIHRCTGAGKTSASPQHTENTDEKPTHTDVVHAQF